MNEFEPVIGLEVHVQLNTQTKLFCGCKNSFGDPPNTNICPVCMGLPGVLPVFNEKVLESGILVSLALNCTVAQEIIFERKNYFYPDLPKGYQISQYMIPLGSDGFLTLKESCVHVRRVHIEEDAGKLVHEENRSLVDLNRAGVPLLEIVSEPDIYSAQQAYEYLNELKLLIQYLGVSGCDMEKGFLRCDANISLRPGGEKKLGIKVELKNMNSFKGVHDALVYEIERQKDVLRSGGSLVQETRLWDEARQKTQVMRTKEEAHDYRYFPEPDLPRFRIAPQEIERIRQGVPETAAQKREKFLKVYGLREKDTEILLANIFLSSFFEKVIAVRSDYQNVANWVIGPFVETLNAKKLSFDDVRISALVFSDIIALVEKNVLNNLAAKTVLCEVIDTNISIEQVITEKGLRQVSGEDELSQFVDEAVLQNPQALHDVKAGKANAIMFLVGCVMKKTKGKANPKVVKELLERRIVL